MKNYIKYGILLMLSIFIFCGCQKEDNDQIAVELTNHITKDLDDNVKIDADIIFPEDTQREVDILEIEPAKLDTQKIVNELYPTAVLFDQERGIYKNGDSYINISNGNFFYDDKEQRIYSRFFTNQEELLSPKAVDIEGFDVDETLETAKQYLGVIGFENIELSEYYVLSKQYLEEQYTQAKMNKDWQKDVAEGREVFKDDWQDEKGAYVFVFSIVEHGLPIVQGMYITKDNEYIEGSSITICCSEDGIAFVEATNHYAVKSPSGKKKIAGTDVIIKGLEQKFSNLIVEEPLVINEIHLAYQAQKQNGKLYLVPVWEVQYVQQCEGNIEKGIIYFDVENGREIVTY